MSIAAERFYKFIKKDRTRNTLAFLFYILFIFIIMGLNLPIVLQIALGLTFLVIYILGLCAWLIDSAEKTLKEEKTSVLNNLLAEIKKVLYEICSYACYS